MSETSAILIMTTIFIGWLIIYFINEDKKQKIKEEIKNENKKEIKKELNEFMRDAKIYIDYLRYFSENSNDGYVYIDGDKYEPNLGRLSLRDAVVNTFYSYCFLKKPYSAIINNEDFDPETADYKGVKLRFPLLNLDEFCKELWKLVNLISIEENFDFLSNEKHVRFCSKSLYDSQLKRIEEEYKNIINENEKKEEEPIYNEDSEDKYDKLFKLKELLDDGAISEEEYNNEKKKILE